MAAAAMSEQAPQYTLSPHVGLPSYTVDCVAEPSRATFEPSLIRRNSSSAKFMIDEALVDMESFAREPAYVGSAPASRMLGSVASTPHCVHEDIEDAVAEEDEVSVAEAELVALEEYV